MVVFEGVHVQILSKSGLAPEHPDPIGAKGRKVNRYIEAEAGTNFGVQVQCGSQIFLKVEGVVCTLLVDGRAVDRVLFHKAEGQSSVLFNQHRRAIPRDFTDMHFNYLFGQAAGCEF